MKRLLALVLCVMLFVSVVPTSAFADTVVSGDAIDLSPAYEARNNLFAAYGLLGAAVASKNIVGMIENSVDLFAPKILELLPAVLGATNLPPFIISMYLSILPEYFARIPESYGESLARYLTNGFMRQYPTGVSYETLFKIFGSRAYMMYNVLGNIFAVGSAELAIDNATLGVFDDINGILNEFGIESATPDLSTPVALGGIMPRVE